MREARNTLSRSSEGAPNAASQRNGDREDRDCLPTQEGKRHHIEVSKFSSRCDDDHT